MIKSLSIIDPKNACIPWFDQVGWLKRKKSLDFTPGVNILFGPNGSGKSTVLKAIARPLHCEQGGTQKVTEHSIRDVSGEMHFEKGTNRSWRDAKDGVLPVHDGSPVIYFDPSDAVGLIGGSFDYDFMELGLQNATSHKSAGQTTWSRAGVWVQAVLENQWPEIERKRAPADWMKKVLEGTLPKDRPTVLLDEPSKSLDILSEVVFWVNTVYMAHRQKVQFIAATHSPFALGLPGVNYIETAPGYLRRVEEKIASRPNLLDRVQEDLLVLDEGCGMEDVTERRLKKEGDRG